MLTPHPLVFVCLFLVGVVGAQSASAAATAEKAVGIASITPAAHLGGRQYALMIGIDDYADPQIPDLSLCERDARALYDLLTTQGVAAVAPENATLLVGKDATTTNVRRALLALRDVPVDATVFVYFSGHGAKAGNEAFWVTQDAELDALPATGFPDRDVRAFIKEIPAQRVVVMIDACYAAATVKGGQKSILDFDDVLNRFTGKGVAYLMAAGSGEEAIEAADLEHSVFTHYLLEGLRGRADADGNADGVVALPELTNYIDHHVAQEARRRGGVQKPTTFQDVQEPAKFRLTIDPDQLARTLRASAEAKAQLDSALAFVWASRDRGVLSAAQTAFCAQALQAPVSQLTPPQAAARGLIQDAAQGRLTVDQLSSRLAVFMLDRPAAAEQEAGADSQVRELERAAARGDHQAAFTLGHLYYGGKGVSTDWNESLKWFTHAAESGHTGAITMAALIHQRGKGRLRDLPKAARLLQQAANAGHHGACYFLGRSYLLGAGVPQSSVQAAHWLTRALQSNEDQYLRNANYLLGVIHSQGLGAPKNLSLAARHLEAAANLNHVKATGLLGALIWNHPELGYSPEQARGLLRIAAQKGDEGAAQMLQKIRP